MSTTQDPRDPDAIRADIEQTRAELSHDVDSLADTANPKHIASRQVDKVKGAVGNVRDKVLGSADDSDDHGSLGDAVGDARAGLSQQASRLGDAAADAPAKAKQKAQGNPLAAGLIAFGAGLLVASLIPASKQEQEAVASLQENLEPLKAQAQAIAQDAAQNLKGPAQEAAESVTDTATDAVDHVKGEATDAKDQVQGRAEEARDTVQDAAGR